MEFINGSKVPFNTVHANNFEFYEELDHVIQKEPLDFIDPELRGLAASIGIRKGKKFAPDERMKKILTDAVAVGNATARAISFRNRDPRAAIYPEQPVEDRLHRQRLPLARRRRHGGPQPRRPHASSSTSPPSTRRR